MKVSTLAMLTISTIMVAETAFAGWVCHSHPRQPVTFCYCPATGEHLVNIESLPEVPICPDTDPQFIDQYELIGQWVVLNNEAFQDVSQVANYLSVIDDETSEEIDLTTHIEGELVFFHNDYNPWVDRRDIVWKIQTAEGLNIAITLSHKSKHEIGGSIFENLSRFWRGAQD